MKEIRFLLFVQETYQKDVAKMYGVSRTSIAQIAQGRSFQRVHGMEAP